MSRSRDRRRKFSQLLERGRRGDELKLRRDDQTVFAVLEDLHEKWVTGLPLDDDDIETLMYQMLELVELPVRRGTNSKSEQAKAEQAKALAWGRRRIKELKAAGHSAEAALRITESDCKSRYPAGVGGWDSSTFRNRLQRRS